VKIALVQHKNLRPGMSVVVEFAIASQPSALVVPYDAVLVRPSGEKIVFTVSDSMAHAHKVSTGIETNTLLEITEGLAEGDKVIIQGQDNLKDGAIVKIMDAAMQNAKGGMKKMKLSDFSINKPLSIIALTVALWVLGLFTFHRLPVNLLPDITYPMVKVYVDWKGATPQDIEDNIAEPLEQKMSTIDKLDYLESQCMEGRYQLLVNFTYDADRDIAYQDVLAKINQVRQKLPKDVNEPLVLKADPSSLPVMDLIITSSNHNLSQLRSWVENYLQPEFVTVSGTAGAEVTGGLAREIRVLIDPFKVQSMGLSPDRIVQRIRDENTESSAGRMIVSRKDNLVRISAEFTVRDCYKNPVGSQGCERARQPRCFHGHQQAGIYPWVRQGTPCRVRSVERTGERDCAYTA
jgi:hypothetical protein